MMLRSILAAAVVMGGWIASTQADEPHADQCVVLISVDGLANYYFNDPQADLSTIRQLAKDGARADGMTCSFPTVTWPNHTTLVTGVDPAKHGVIGNNYLDRETGKPVPLIPDPLFDKEEIVKVPTIYDVAHEAGLKTAGIIWPASRNAKTLDWTVPDMAGDDAWPNYGTPSWMKELKEAGIPVEKHGTWVRESSGGVQRDWLYTRLFEHVMEHHAPNLVLIHLIEVDHTEHRFGPQSPEAYWAVSYADDRVRDIVESARNSKYGKNVTIVVASDHGFFPIDRTIYPNVLFQKMFKGEDEPQVRSVSQGGGCFVYILDDENREATRKKLMTALAGVEGVESVFGPEDFAKLGHPLPSDDPRGADLCLSAESGYSFSDSTKGEDVVAPRGSLGGTHGYRPDQPAMYATLVMAGRGIRSGVDLGTVSNRDVAPTIARLLGLKMPTADGNVLEKALTD